MGRPAPAGLLTGELAAIARDAAEAAGALLRERFHAPRSALRSKSSPTDLVSEADLEAERLIRDLLAQRRPDDVVLGEEEGAGAGDGAVRWVVDPLDGTINFLFGIPQFAVSVACEDVAGTIVGVVHDPVRGETFSATRDGPATVNGQRIAGSACDELASALVATGFAYDSVVRAGQAAVLQRVLPRVRDVRRAGSAALDLAWTACGRHDAYYERGLNAWDWAAGALLCARAGLTVRSLPPDGRLPEGLLAAPPPLAGALLGLVGP